MNGRKTIKWGLISLLLLISAVIFVGCGATPVQQTNETDQQKTESETKLSEGKFPVTLTDDAGNEVTIDEEPQKIVSIQTSITEISFALGLGDKIIGVSDYCNFPEEANNKEKIGARDMNAERILELLPDLVMVTDHHHEKHANILDQYRQAGSKVIVIGSASSFEETYHHMRMIAKATGTNEKAEEIIQGMKAANGNH